jgi:hypothetical protein
MKLNYSLTYILYFGLAVMLAPLKLNYTNTAQHVDKKKVIEAKPTHKAKAEVLHSELLFKY